MSGASWGTVFRRIVVPLMVPSLFAGWIWVFLISIRDLPVALLLYSPGSEVISVAIFEMWDFGKVTDLAAFSTFVTLILAPIALVLYKFSTRYGLKVNA